MNDKMLNAKTYINNVGTQVNATEENKAINNNLNAITRCRNISYKALTIFGDTINKPSKSNNKKSISGSTFEKTL